MGKKSGTQTVSQAPWGPTQGGLQFAMSELDRLYGRPMSSGSNNAFDTGRLGGGFFGGNRQFGMLPRYTGDPRSGSSVASFMPFPQSQPTQPQSSPAPAPSPVQEYGLVDPAAAELLATIRGDRLNQNPYLDEVIRRASADVNSQFAGMGRYGSGAHMDSLFTRAAGPIRYADYAQERANQLAAIQAAPGFEMAPFQLHAARTAAPYEGIRNYLELLNPIARGGSEQSTPIYRNPMAGAVGGALGGAALGSAAGAAGLAGGGLGAGGALMAAPALWPFLLGGALLGGLAS